MKSIDHGDYTIEQLLIPINNALKNGSYMTSANFAFMLLCDKLNVNEDTIPNISEWLNKGDKE